MFIYNISRNFSRLYCFAAKVPLGFLKYGHSVKKEPKIWRMFSVSLTTRAGFDIHKDNIILMGSPGCGKTTVGGILSKKLEVDFVDVDDHLESYWDMPVSEKLAQLGSDDFIQAEGEGLQHLHVSRSVVALSGSNPMHATSMEHIRKTGLVVYLDVNNDDILGRLQKMKTSRIVGQESGTPMHEILPHRQQFYENNYDIRIICGAHESPESIANKVLEAVERLKQCGGYISTRAYHNVVSQKTFSDILLEGLAADGGLYVPQGILPHFETDQWARLVPLTFPERAQRILEQWITPYELHPSVLAQMVHTAYAEMSFPVEKLYQDKLYNHEYIMELFHGPTASFKDGSLQLTSKLFQHAMSVTNASNQYLILVATSGDTGGAVLDSFSKLNENNIRVLVLYPEGGISELQKVQITSADSPNVKAIGVKSDFDYCQTTIKKIFSDRDVKLELLNKYNCKLSAANSINWGRLLPQVAHHASAYLELVKERKIYMGQEIDLCIPTGNFGNMLAAYYAKEMGIPFRYLICASNMNNILTEFFNTGHYVLASRQLHRSISPAIDILKSSNLERFLYHVLNRDNEKICEFYEMLDKEGRFSVSKRDLKKIQDLVLADWCVESCVGRCIQDTYKKTGYLMDPHTAVAKVVADKFRDDEVPIIIASTAHYAKFAPDVLQSLGHQIPDDKDYIGMFKDLEALPVRPGMHQKLKQNVLKPIIHNQVIEPSTENLIREIKSFLAA